MKIDVLLRFMSLGALVACAIQPSLAGEVVDVTSATDIDPAGGATIRWDNPHWSKAFTVLGDSQFEPRSLKQIGETRGITVIDFETSSGFPEASLALDESGGVFRTLERIEPFNASQKITRISTTRGHAVTVDCRYFDEATGKLFKHPWGGVFLVKDRAENDGMPSGKQGLIAGPVRLAYGDTDRAGVYLTFDKDVADFSATVNASSSALHGPSNLIVLFDASGEVIAKYSLGVKSYEPVYFGVHALAANIRSVWIGQRGDINGLIVDNIAFGNPHF